MVRRGVRLASVCSGAYILAAKPDCSMVAAPPRIGAAPGIFHSAHPKVKLEPDRIFVRDGNI